MSDPAQTRRIAVVGGGPTGLAAAYRITRLGHQVRLFESSDRLGGAIQSVRENGWLVEAGPNSLLENSLEIAGLWRELGLENDRLVADVRAKKRYIVRDGVIAALPSSPWSLLTTECWSQRSTRRLIADLWRRPIARPRDVDIASLVKEHFGKEIVDFALNPFVSGVYAGDPHHLSAQHAFPRLWAAEKSRGSLVRGMMLQAKMRRRQGHPKSAMITFRDGLQQITDALAGRLPSGAIELSTQVRQLRRDNARWSFEWQRGDSELKPEFFDAVILAIPALALAQLRIERSASGTAHKSGESPTRPLEGLAQIRYSAVASLFLGFPRESVSHPLDGFGLLAPAVEKRAILGVIFSSTLFPNRVPAGMVGLTVMIGGATRPELVGAETERILDAVMPDLRELLGVTGDPVFKKLHRWLRAIPQYELGYDRFFAEIAACEEQHAGLFIAGNIRNGIALPACLEAGLAVGAQAAAAAPRSA